MWRFSLELLDRSASIADLLARRLEINLFSNNCPFDAKIQCGLCSVRVCHEEPRKLESKEHQLLCAQCHGVWKLGRKSIHTVEDLE